jgi:hypothetical protein
MPLKLNVGVSRKVGLSNYASMGATCNLEVELDSTLLHHDLAEFHSQVRDAYVAAHQAVNDELARLQNPQPLPATAHPNRLAVFPISTPRNGDPQPRTSAPASFKPATPKQVRAIFALGRHHPTDLDAFLHDHYGVSHPEELSLSDASRVIDALKHEPSERTG